PMFCGAGSNWGRWVSTRNWQDLGLAEATRGRWGAAIDAFGEAADLSPEDPAPLYNLGEISFRRWQETRSDDHRAAARWHRTAIEAYGSVEGLQPGFRSVRQRLAELGDTP
ncbi:MAG: tetratricopeptide repeat protein, partial [Candidatus Latescibacteria bacterium]|nr:tetratricopeptide repeat protein [Candidatus Latescibacterota bacterium]